MQEARDANPPSPDRAVPAEPAGHGCRPSGSDADIAYYWYLRSLEAEPPDLHPFRDAASSLGRQWRRFYSFITRR